jgi:hypothetical protein
MVDDFQEIVIHAFDDPDLIDGPFHFGPSEAMSALILCATDVMRQKLFNYVNFLIDQLPSAAENQRATMIALITCAAQRFPVDAARR